MATWEDRPQARSGQQPADEWPTLKDVAGRARALKDAGEPVAQWREVLAQGARSLLRVARLESDPPTHKPGSEAAAYEALRLIREKPEHPDLARWVLELVDPASLIDRSLLEGITTAADLAAEPVPDRQWLVDTLLPSRGLSVVFGYPGAGKSTALRNLAVTVARTSGYWMGRRMLHGGPVGYLALDESDRDAVAEDFRRMGGSDALHVHVGPLEPPKPLHLLDAMLEAFRPRLMIVDTLASFASDVESSNDNADMTRALIPLQERAQRFDTHLMLVAHPSKSNPDRPYGAIAIEAKVDLVLQYAQEHDDDDGRRWVRTTKGRNGAYLDKLHLDFDPETRTNRPTAHPPDDSTRSTVVNVLRGQQDSTGVTTVADITGIPPRTVRHHLNELRKAGSVKRIRNGRGYLYSLSN